jgi:hypothetical protein
MKRRTATSMALPFLATVLIASPLWSQASLSNLPEGQTEAFRTVVPLHAADIAKLPRPADAGIWLVQDGAGHRISSAVLATFPAGIGSDNYGDVVPGAAGLHAIAFGFARTPVVAGLGPFRVVYVTVAAAPAPRAAPH